MLEPAQPFYSRHWAAPTATSQSPGLLLEQITAGDRLRQATHPPRPEMVTVIVREAPVADTPGSPVETPRRLSPGELELEAEKTLVKADSARLFREAGDSYVRDRADYQSALRCYRNFLDEAAPAERTVSPEDTWLLTSLKRAREQETNP